MGSYCVEYNWKVIALNYGKQNSLAGFMSLTFDENMLVALLTGKGYQLVKGFRAYYPHDHLAQCQPLLNKHSNEYAHGKSQGIGQIGRQVIHILKNLANSQQPDQRFKESQEGGNEFPASHYEYDPKSIDGHINNPCKKYQKGQDHETEYIGIYAEITGKELFHSF